MPTLPAESVWHPLAISGSASTRMESWACPPDCHAPCPLREATFWPETRAVVNATVGGLPNGRYDMRWTGTHLETRPADRPAPPEETPMTQPTTAPLFAVVFDRPGPDSVYAWGPFTDPELAGRFAGFVSAEIDPAKVLPWEEARALAGPRVLDPMRELLAWRENVALPQITEADETRTELAVVKGQLRAAQQEAYDAETRAAQLRDALNDATATN